MSHRGTFNKTHLLSNQTLNCSRFQTPIRSCIHCRVHAGCCGGPVRGCCWYLAHFGVQRLVIPSWGVHANKHAVQLLDQTWRKAAVWQWSFATPVSMIEPLVVVLSAGTADSLLIRCTGSNPHARPTRAIATTYISWRMRMSQPQPIPAHTTEKHMPERSCVKRGAEAHVSSWYALFTASPSKSPDLRIRQATTRPPGQAQVANIVPRERQTLCGTAKLRQSWHSFGPAAHASDDTRWTAYCWR